MNALMRAGGYTLIEVLVSLLLLAVGALGAQALMLSAGAAAHHASVMSVAIQLAGTAADAMRANAALAAGADSANPYLQLDYDALADGPPAPATDCSASTCDGAALAAADLAALRLATFTRMPLGRIKICRDSASWDTASSSLRWECNGAAGAPAVVKVGWRQQGRPQGGAATGAPVMLALPAALRAGAS